MVRRRTVTRTKKVSGHLTKRNKKIRNLHKLQGNIEGWDRNLSFTTNIDKLGLNNRNVNEKVEKILKNDNPNPGLIEAEEIDIDQIQRLNKMAVAPDQVEKKKNKVKLTLDEEWAVEQMVHKYKQDYQLMSKDHKKNSFQWTAVQCQKKHEQYLKKHGKCPKN